MTLLDSTGEIQAVAFGDEAERMINMLHHNSTSLRSCTRHRQKKLQRSKPSSSAWFWITLQLQNQGNNFDDCDIFDDYDFLWLHQWLVEFLKFNRFSLCFFFSVKFSCISVFFFVFSFIFRLINWKPLFHWHKTSWFSCPRNLPCSYIVMDRWTTTFMSMVSIMWAI